MSVQRNFNIQILIRLICLILIAICGFVSVNAEEVTCKDSTGTVFTLRKAPERVAVLFSSFAEMWTDAGGTVTVTVGETTERGFAGQNAILVDTGAGKHIDLEKLISAAPDLVIGSSDIPAQVEAVEILRAAGIQALLFKVETFSDYESVFHVMTEITGREDLYRRIAGTQHDQIEELLNGSPSPGADEQTCVFIRAGGSVFLVKQSDEHFVAGMLKELGFRNIADDGLDWSDDYSTEKLLTEDPDWIFISLMGDEESAAGNAENTLSRPPWIFLFAVRNGRTVILPKELFHYKPNSRWAEAYQYLAEKVTVK